MMNESLQESIQEFEELQNLLDRVDSPHDLKTMDLEQLELLAGEIRNFLITKLAVTGGHLAPNLGIVELTIAIHKVFDLPLDQLIFDVGHQVYVHKILTGRKHRFDSLRQFEGLSGFSNREESIYDCFTTGHGGTSISAALGKAVARDLKGETHNVLALIGDGALTEGMALEALNHLGHIKTRLIVILNDNAMSIAPNVGGYSRYLDRIRNEPHIRSSKEYMKHLVRGIPHYGSQLYQLMSRVKDSFKYLITPGIMFEELGLRYVGPVDGHNLSDLIEAFSEVKTIEEPILLHVRTTKGKGFAPAEDTSCSGAKWHGGGPFNPASGSFIKPANPAKTYSQIFGDTLSVFTDKDPLITAITAAMPDGTGLASYAKKHPANFFDVAMAEQHAVTFASGLASEGYKPFAAIYSTFLQRAYDQIIHDVCLQNLPVRFCLDRGGLVGADGPTHHGVFDYAYLRCLPNMVIMAPKDEQEFVQMLKTMWLHEEGPIAVRYPRGNTTCLPVNTDCDPVSLGSAEILKQGKDLILLAVGSMVPAAMSIAKEIEVSLAVEVGVINARFIKPLDTDLFKQMLPSAKALVTLEEGTIHGGFGSAVLEWLSQNHLIRPLYLAGIPDEFVTHGNMEELYKQIGLDDQSLIEKITTWYKRNV